LTTTFHGISDYMAGYQFLNKIILTGSQLKSLHIKHFASHHFPKYFHIIKKAIFRYWTSLNPHHGIFFDRFVMVVRRNVLEYIIALVVVKNKLRLKKCFNKFQIWQSSIVQMNLSITSLRLIPKFRPVSDDQC
jgi:hypothetical protein